MALINRLKMEVIFFIARRQPTCRELAPWMSQAIDGELSLKRRMTLWLHFKICALCKRYQAQLIRLRDHAHQLATLENSPALASARLSDEARERMKRALSQRGS